MCYTLCMATSQTTITGKTLTIFIPDTLLKEIEDFRFRERALSRVQAIRMLLKIGVDASQKKAAAK
jgi:metal-responsive CopG/Arc/MetJ family transcriptional regulator